MSYPTHILEGEKLLGSREPRRPGKFSPLPTNKNKDRVKKVLDKNSGLAGGVKRDEELL